MSVAQDKHPAPVPSGVTPPAMATGPGWRGLAGTFPLFPWRQIILQHRTGLQCPDHKYWLDQSWGYIWGAGTETGPVLGEAGLWGARLPRGPELRSGAARGEAAGPAYHLAVQALQVEDERLVVCLAPGDFHERPGSLAQQLLLRQLVNTARGGGGGSIIRAT